MLPEVPTAVPEWLTIAVGFTAVFASTVLARLAGLHGRLGALPVLAVAAVCWLAVCLGSAFRRVHTVQPFDPSPVEEPQRG